MVATPASPIGQRRWKRALVRGLGIAALSVLAVLVALEVGFRAMPQLIPLGACQSSLTLAHGYCEYNYRYDDPLRLGFIFKPGYAYDDSWNPADPAVIDAADETCAETPDQTFRLSFKADDKGFVNNATPWQDHYDIVVTGDSFTQAFAPVWWVDLLEQQTGMSMLNLGMQGWGPLSEVEAVRVYGLDKHPRWVLLLYFEGNDLFAAEEYHLRQESGMDWRSYQLHQVGPLNRLVMTHVLNYWGDKVWRAIQPESPYCRYPMTVSTNVNQFETLFYTVHVSQLSEWRDEIEPSLEWKLTTQAFLGLRDEVVARGGRFLLVYVPAKEHLYWSRLWDTQDIGHYLELTTPLRSYQEFAGHIDDQMLLMQDFAAANNIDLLNLTGDLWQRTMLDGVEYYNYADVHWNEAGNRLVAQLLADYLLEHADTAPDP